jgi:hypothetical protein
MSIVNLCKGPRRDVTIKEETLHARRSRSLFHDCTSHSFDSPPDEMAVRLVKAVFLYLSNHCKRFRGIINAADFFLTQVLYPARPKPS